MMNNQKSIEERKEIKSNNQKEYWKTYKINGRGRMLWDEHVKHLKQ